MSPWHSNSAAAIWIIRRYECCWTLGTTVKLKSRILLDVLACALVLSCGGSLFTSNSGDAGTDASPTGSSTSATTGTTTAGSTSTTVGAGGSTGSTGVGVGGAPGTTGTGGAGGRDWSLCSAAGQCIPELRSCCGVCGMPELGDFAGVNR